MLVILTAIILIDYGGSGSKLQQSLNFSHITVISIIMSPVVMTATFIFETQYHSNGCITRMLWLWSNSTWKISFTEEGKISFALLRKEKEGTQDILPVQVSVPITQWENVPLLSEYFQSQGIKEKTQRSPIYSLPVTIHAQPPPLSTFPHWSGTCYKWRTCTDTPSSTKVHSVH